MMQQAFAILPAAGQYFVCEFLNIINRRVSAERPLQLRKGYKYCL